MFRGGMVNQLELEFREAVSSNFFFIHTNNSSSFKKNSKLKDTSENMMSITQNIINNNIHLAHYSFQ